MKRSELEIGKKYRREGYGDRTVVAITKDNVFYEVEGGDPLGLVIALFLTNNELIKPEPEIIESKFYLNTIGTVVIDTRTPNAYWKEVKPVDNSFTKWVLA